MSYYSLEEKEASLKWLNKALETNPEINIGGLLCPFGFESLYARAKEEAGKSAQRPAPASIVKEPVVKVSYETGEKKKKKSALLFIVGGVAVAGALTYVLLAKKKTSKPTTGSIQVNSTPTGAKVYLDGSDSGKTTNCTLPDVSAGSHAIKLVKDGYVDYSGSAAVTAGQTVTVDATLTANTITVIAPTASTNWTKGSRVDIKWQVTATAAGQAQTIISSQMGQTALMRQRLLAQHLGASQVRRDAGERLSDGRTAARSVRADVSRESAGNLINRDSALIQSEAQGPAGATLSPGLMLPQPRLDSLKGGLAAGSFSATASLSIAKVRIDLYKGSTLITPPIVSETSSSTGTCSWMVPTNLADGSNYKVRISCTTDSTVFKDSGAFTISEPAGLSVTPSTGLISSGVEGGPFYPLSKHYTLKNDGGKALKWKAAKTRTWTTLSSPLSGTLAAGASATVIVSINSHANSLAAGTYGDTVTFTNTTNGIGNTTRSVSLEVEEGPPVLKVKPDNRNVSSSAGTTTFDVSNTGGGTMNWDAAVTTGGSWLTIQSGSQHGTNSGTITAEFTANPEATARTGIIRVGAVAEGSPAKVTVTQAGARGLSVTPLAGLTSSGDVGGPFSPSSKDYELQNNGETALDWTATKTETWTTLSGYERDVGCAGPADNGHGLDQQQCELACGGNLRRHGDVHEHDQRDREHDAAGEPDGWDAGLIVSSLTGSFTLFGASFSAKVKNDGDGVAGALEAEDNRQNAVLHYQRIVKKTRSISPR